MNHLPSPPSLSATTISPNRLIYGPRSASNLSSNAQSISTLTPAIIPLDYNYQTMSPSSISQLSNDHTASAATIADNNNAYHSHSHSRFSSERHSGNISVDFELDNQYSSLFGDPVPPQPPLDFLSSPFDPVSLFHSSSIEISSGSDEDAIGRLTNLESSRDGQHRLFSNIPFNSVFSRRTSDTASQHNFDVLPTPMQRLQPPDIQILANSSEASSSDAHQSPNYSLLTPYDVTPRPSAYNETVATDVTEIVESLEARDAKGLKDYSEATRRVSNFSDDFRSNVGSLSNTQESPLMDTGTTEPPFKYCKFSKDSYNSNEWFRPATQDYPEFSKIPKLRPSSKNVMSIKNEEMQMRHSPVAAIINDSNGSSSGEERFAVRKEATNEETKPPARPPDPSPSILRELEGDLFPLPQDFFQQRSEEDAMNQQNFSTPPPPAAPPPPDFYTSSDVEHQETIKREMSPVILRDSIFTGSEFRVDQPRLHKKTSFTIIAQKSPHSSRAPSPSSHSHQQRSPSKISKSSGSLAAKPVAKPRQYLQQKSLSTTQLKLPKLPQQHNLQTTTDDSPRPSVQFNMTGRHTPNMMTQRGILQHRESFSSSQEITPLSPSKAFKTPLKLRRPSALPTFAKQADKSKVKSLETLPLITDPYRTAIPRFNRSITDLHRESAVFPPGALPRPLKPNPNPTRKQKGLLRILNGDSSHIPLRSNWCSMDDLSIGRHLKMPKLTPLTDLTNRRRSSSTSAERRSSTQTASDRRSSNISSVTTSDFSFRRPSMVAQQSRKAAVVTPSPRMTRRQSVIPATNLNSGRTSRSKIAKPSTLSPIIGTPNKDGSNPQSPEQNGAASLAPSDTPSDVTTRRNSLSRIPVSSTPSQHGSRSSSPLKDFTTELSLFESHSQSTSSRTTSRATGRHDISHAASRTNSQPASRSTSRASTHPVSRGTSRASTRPNSRMEMAKEIANSRSTSRMSVRSNISMAQKISSLPQPKQRRKSISVSPVLNRNSRARRQSLSPPNKKRSGSRGRNKKVRNRPETRNNSRSHIPLRARSIAKAEPSSSPKPKLGKGSYSASPNKLKDLRREGKTSPLRSSKSLLKRSTSAKKTPTSVLKQDSSVKRTLSSVGKQTAAIKKQPSTMQKTGGSNLRREASHIQKKDAVISVSEKVARKEGTAADVSAKKTRSSSSATTVAVAASGLKRQATSKSLRKTVVKSSGPALISSVRNSKKKSNLNKPNPTKASSKSDNATKKTEGKATKNKDPSQMIAATSPIGIESAKVADIASAVATGVVAISAVRGPANVSSGSTGSSGSNAAIKRNASNVSLVRMASRMSLLSMKRSDSNLSKKKVVSAVAEEGNGVSKASEKPAVLKKTNSRTQLRSPEDTAASAILEKSQKTLENIQMTVTNATEEIHKTINENLTDLKSMETDMSLFSDSAGSPTSSVTTVVENKIGSKAIAASSGGAIGDSVSRSGTADGSSKNTTHKNGSSSAQPTGIIQKSPLPSTQPVEADVSVLNAAPTNAKVSPAAALPHESVAEDGTIERNYTYDGDGAADKTGDRVLNGLRNHEVHGTDVRFSGPNVTDRNGGGHNGDDDDDVIKRRSPDGQGGSTAGSRNGSREFLKAPEDDSTSPPGCCHFCTKLCLPCRRLSCSHCCHRKPKKSGDDSEEPVLSATSTASTTNLGIIHEAHQTADSIIKTSCWQKLNCCKSCRRKQSKNDIENESEHSKMTTATGKTEIKTTAAAVDEARLAPNTSPIKQNKCGLCMSKLFCCRRINKVDPITGDETELKKCCFCIPCRRKKGGRGAAIGSTVTPAGSVAWQDLESGIAVTDASVVEGASLPEMQSSQGCCKRFWSKLLCCRKKVPKASESRRASIKAPPPPSEDTRRKLHVDLVEYNSKMKGAIPVLPLSLAWFCVICNTVVPGLGTLFSGIFCLCVGIPRFSQYDSAKARFGSFIINIIVSVAQFFCVLFCFVGWGWSIWWGTIMLKCARKLSKIKKVERLEMEEERRQADAAAAAAATAARVAANAGVTTTESSA